MTALAAKSKKPEVHRRSKTAQELEVRMQSDGAEFHIFASIKDAEVELLVPDDDIRIQFCSLFAAARHARNHPKRKNATIIVHDPFSNRVNRIPLYESDSAA